METESHEQRKILTSALAERQRAAELAGALTLAPTLPDQVVPGVTEEADEDAAVIRRSARPGAVRNGTRI